MAFCTCYGGNDLNCEVHHPRPAAPQLTTHKVVEGDYCKVDIDDYNRLLEAFRGFRDQLVDGDYGFCGLMLIAIDMKGRIFAPVICEHQGAKKALPDAMEMVAKALRRMDAN